MKKQHKKREIEPFTEMPAIPPIAPEIEVKPDTNKPEKSLPDFKPDRKSEIKHIKQNKKNLG